ncbi:HmuY family protein [Capnocytophaga leadbetteri]|uniref:HmuY family protein n=1 Tax=Capnocytophaga leadbetteri TaxID=327575 RepID=UPI0028EB90E9|nr:HmuY family protein [Capnocytophaga leadbetteri]
MKLQFLVPAVMAGMMLFSTSCKKDDDPITNVDRYEGLRNLNVKPGEEKEIKYLDASSNQGEWVYFSFEKGVLEATTATPTVSNWDIAFNRYDIRTNSGTSGKGNGGALNTQQKDWSKVATASSTATYTVDIVSRGFSYGGNRSGSTVYKSLSPVFEVGHGEGFWNMVSGSVTSTIPNFSTMPKPQQQAILASMKSKIVHNNGWLTMDYAQGAKAPTYAYNNWVYIVKTARGKYAKIQLTDYTNAKNKTGFITFKYQLSNDRNEFK